MDAHHMPSMCCCMCSWRLPEFGIFLAKRDSDFERKRYRVGEKSLTTLAGEKINKLYKTVP